MWKVDPHNPTTLGIERIDRALVKQCGFSNDDFDLIRSYVEYRKSR